MMVNEVTLPQLVKEDTDLVALVRTYRESIGLTQFEVDMIVNYEDGYTSKMEGPHRAYGRKPSKLNKPLSVSFERVDGTKMVATGVVNTKSSTILSGPACWWIEACELALVLMPRAEALEMCKRPIPMQSLAPKTKSGKRHRKLSIEMEIIDIGIEPAPIESIDPHKLKSLATRYSKAYQSGKAGNISKVLAAARAQGVDVEALAMAAKLNKDTGLKLANLLARVAAYTKAINNPDININTLDVFESVRDDRTELKQLAINHAESISISQLQDGL